MSRNFSHRNKFRTTLLEQTKILLNLYASLFSASLNAVGIWMVSCIVMVFSALSEYGFLLYIMTYQLRTKNNSQDRLKDSKNNRIFASMGTIHSQNRREKGGLSENKESRQTEGDLSDQNHADNPSIPNEIKLQNKMRKIDSASLFLFPLVFFSFIVVYLVVFLK